MTATAEHLFEGADWDFSKLQRICNASTRTYIGSARCCLMAGSSFLGILRAKQPIVSGGHLKNSRFCEIAAGDRVRSALRGRCDSFGVKTCSPIRESCSVASAPFVGTVARVASVKMKETTVRLVELGLKAKK
jgi:hypothetical protein